MSTGRFLTAVGVVLVLLTGLACYFRFKEEKTAATVLVWASDDNPARAAQIEAFNRSNPDLKLVLDYHNLGLQNVARHSSEGSGPDIIDVSGHFLQAYAEAGVLMDVTDIAGKMGFSVEQQGWPQAAEAAICFGRQYGYYCNVGVPILIYNKNVFDYFKVPYPDESLTWEAFITLASKVNTGPTEVPNERIYALVDATTDVYFGSLGGEIFDENGFPDLTNSALQQAYQWKKDMLQKYKLAPSSTELKTMSGRGGWASGAINQFATGNFAMMLAGDWTLVGLTVAYENQIRERDPSVRSATHLPCGKPLRLGACPLPHITGKPPRYIISTRMAGINSLSPKRDQALRVLQYFAGPTYSALINRDMDWLPGNPEYAESGLVEKYPDLSRLQMHSTTTRSMAYGYVQRRSPFLLANDVSRILEVQMNRLETEERVVIADLLTQAQADAMLQLRRNIERKPHLKTLFEERTKTKNASY